MFLVVAMGPPGGGRTVISERLQSRFNLFNMTFPQVSNVQTPLTSICCWFVVQQAVEQIHNGSERLQQSHNKL